MKSVKRYFFVLGLMFALVGHAFATPQTVEGSSAEASSKSLYWGPRLSVLLSNAWNNKRVKGVFDSYSNEVWENSVLRTGFGMEFGVCAWYMLNDYFGLAAEADMRFVEHRLNKQVYSRQEWKGYGTYDIEEYYLYVYSASFPLLMRLRPVRYMYLEAGAQIVFNFDGEITDKDGDDEHDFEQEKLGYSVLGGAGITFPVFRRHMIGVGFRLTFDMTRIEHSGVVEIKEGETYRMATPARLWNIQFGASYYF